MIARSACRVGKWGRSYRRRHHEGFTRVMTTAIAWRQQGDLPLALRGHRLLAWCGDESADRAGAAWRGGGPSGRCCWKRAGMSTLCNSSRGRALRRRPRCPALIPVAAGERWRDRATQRQDHALGCCTAWPRRRRRSCATRMRRTCVPRTTCAHQRAEQRAWGCGSAESAGSGKEKRWRAGPRAWRRWRNAMRARCRAASSRIALAGLELRPT